MKIINIYMKDDFSQMWESCINTKLEGNANCPVGDEHNPGEEARVQYFSGVISLFWRYI